MTAYMDHRDLTNEIVDQARAQGTADGVHRVLDRITSAEFVIGRTAGSVQLLATTKTRDVDEILTVIGADIHVIGENRPQEVIAKVDSLAERLGECGYPLGAIDAAEVDTVNAAAATHTPFHLIGQLQANRIDKVLPVADTIESVDPIGLVEKIARRVVMRSITAGVLLEVNESGKEPKSSCAPSHTTDLTQRIGAMDGLRLRGLTAIGAHVDDEHTIRVGFAHLRRTRDQTLISDAKGTADRTELSMGMAHDMTYAIEEGSTIVRVGTATSSRRAFT